MLAFRSLKRVGQQKFCDTRASSPHFHTVVTKTFPTHIIVEAASIRNLECLPYSVSREDRHSFGRT